MLESDKWFLVSLCTVAASFVFGGFAWGVLSILACIFGYAIGQIGDDV